MSASGSASRSVNENGYVPGSEGGCGKALTETLLARFHAQDSAICYRERNNPPRAVVGPGSCEDEGR